MARNKVKRPKMNAGHVERALRLHVNFRTNKLIPEATVAFTKSRWDSYRADYMIVSASDFCTELEIKVSMSDWKNDLKKPKWNNMPSWINRFIYVVPEHLGVPDWVPSFAGVWHVCSDIPSNRMWIKVVRTPKRIGKEKVPADILNKWIGNLYYRFWNMRIERDKRLPHL